MKKKISLLLTFLIPLLVGCNSSNKPEAPASLFIKEKPIQTTYTVHDKLSLEGLVVTDQKGKTVTDYLTSLNDGDELNKIGTTSIEISKQKYKSAYLTITVKDATKGYLEVENKPSKLIYNVGEALSLSGLKVTYEGDEITDYTVKIAGEEYKEGFLLYNPGTNKVFVEKEGFERNFFTITVNNDSYKPTDTKNITTYHVNDMHGAFIRQDTDANYSEMGMSCISKYLYDKKKENPDTTLILSGGDMFQGGIESNHTHGLIFIDAMNHAGFDAMTVGNHDFDWGERYLKNFAIYSDFAYLSCNIFYADKVTRPSYLEPYTIVYRDGVKIGIIGAAIENMGIDITQSVASQFYFPDPIPYVKQYSDYLKKEAKCDLVFGVFHDGGFNNNSVFKFSSLTNVSQVSGEKYLDGIYLAHDHQRKSGSENGVPYIEAACNGRIIGETYYTLNNNTGSYSVSSFYSNCYYRYEQISSPDSYVDSLTEKYSEYIPDPDEVLTVFSRALSREEFLQIYCKALIWFVNNNTDVFGKTINLASTNYGGIRSSVDEGEFKLRDLEKIIPFDNSIAIQKCTINNITNIKNSGWVGYYQEGNIVYEQGYTYCASLSFICESETAITYYQESYVDYPEYIGKDALAAYLRSGVRY